MQVLRLGKISSVNYALGTARVTYEDRAESVTAELPFLSGEYMMPDVGDTVVTAHFSSTSAVILGRLWSDSNRPAESGAGLYRKELSRTQGEAYVRYDDTSKTLTIRGSNITIDGDLTVTGQINGGEV